MLGWGVTRRADPKPAGYRARPNKAASLLRENALGACHRALATRVHLAGLPQSPCKRLERRLHDVVGVGARQLC